MTSGIRLREWRVAEMRRQELLDEAAQRQRRVAAQSDAASRPRSVRLREAIRTLQAELGHAIENASLERPRPGPRGFRDGLTPGEAEETRADGRFDLFGRGRF